MDCGPSCLKIIAKYYGKYYSLQYLRDKCGSTREGTSFHDLSYGAEAIGLRSIVIETGIVDVRANIALPAIVHWQSSHFVVLYKITSNRVYVSDPAKGLVSYSTGEFERNWYKNEGVTGVIMVIEPQSDFRQREEAEHVERAKTLENFISYFYSYKKSFANLFVVMLMVTLLQALLPFISKAVIDVGIRTGDVHFIDMILIGNIVIVVSIVLFNAVRDWILLHITSRVNISMISDYLMKLLALPVSFFENKMVGDILQRANDHERIRSFIMNNSLNLVFSTVTFFIFSIILATFNLDIFLIFIIGSVIYITWILIFLKIRKKLDWEYFDLTSKNQSFWVEAVASIQDIKLNNYEKAKRWKWEKVQARLYKVNQRMLTIQNWQSSGAQCIDSLKNLFITFIAAKSVIQGEITFGIMISSQFILGMLNGPITQLLSFVVSAQYAHISFLRLNEIHQLPKEEDDEKNNNMILPGLRSLTLKNVSFHYSANAKLTLSNINLVIPQGKITAIVGDSGSGKSTLLKIILRLYKPTYGDILMGEMNINNISLKQWRDCCGAVMQDGKIFNDTILNNIVLDDENVNYDALRKAVDAASIGDEIEQMPLGYQTVMGEMGRGLSGGQKQRILIARALYKNPDYLFFDEATNSLDTINEQKIIAALDEIFEGRTVIVVAHRLSTIRKADQIIVMKNGTIIETGNHDTLLAKGGQYYQLCLSQYHGNSNELYSGTLNKHIDLI